MYIPSVTSIASLKRVLPRFPGLLISKYISQYIADSPPFIELDWLTIQGPGKAG